VTNPVLVVLSEAVVKTAARAAVTAWEAANGWLVEPAYARRRLALLEADEI
jgi:hypothetical protein